jgi:2-hydroxychromene-2-carboxylate isomerase
MRTVLPLRLALAAEADGGGDAMVRLVHALFTAMWVDDRDIADSAVVAAIAAAHGIAPATVERAHSDPAIKQALIANMEEAAAAGAFGVPSFVVRGHLFWGQDRLEMVGRALGGWEPPR